MDALSDAESAGFVDRTAMHEHRHQSEPAVHTDARAAAFAKEGAVVADTDPFMLSTGHEAEPVLKGERARE